MGSNTLVTKRFTYYFDFWFTRNIGQSLPLDALNQHEIELIFNIETKDNVLGDNININSSTFKPIIYCCMEIMYLLMEKKKKVCSKHSRIFD